MPVEVRIPTMMRSEVGGQATVAATGGTIGEVIDDLVTRFPGLGGKLRTGDGSLHRFVNVYIDDEDVRYLDGLETTVPTDAVVSILPAVAGGAR